MRIAIYHNLPSGGAKRALLEIVQRLSAHHDLYIFTLSTAEQDFADVRKYCRDHRIFHFTPLPLLERPLGRLNQGLRTVDLIRLRRLQQRIAREIDDAHYDVVFVHHCRYGQSPALLQFLQTPSVYYCQEPPRQIYEPEVSRPYNNYSLGQRIINLFDPFPATYCRILKRIDRQNVLAAAKVLVNSEYSRESVYRAYGIFAGVAYLGVNLNKFRAIPIEKKPFVLSVGQLNPRKGFDFLIHSLSLIEQKRRPQLRIVSNATASREHEFLARLAEEFEVEVIFETAISDELLVNLYNQALLTVYAPIMEPFGFVPLESMACATPVVAVREAGVRETVRHGDAGLLVPREPAAFAAAVERLLQDDKLRVRLGHNGRQHVCEEWQWDRSTNRITEHLTSVVR